MIEALLLTTGLIFSDDFNAPEVSANWERMNHPEVVLYQEAGWLQVRLTPSGQYNGGYHIGAMTKPAVYSGIPGSAVLAAKYRLPNFTYQCGDWLNYSYYQLHLCNVQPDVNYSIQVDQTCPAKFAGLTEQQLPLDVIQNDGVEMMVTYVNEVGEGFVFDPQGVPHSTGKYPLTIEDNKRIELKAPFGPVAVETWLEVDWVELYRSPVDHPVKANSTLQGAQVRLSFDGYSETGSPFSLPVDIIYPVTATFDVLVSDVVVESVVVDIYPGDEFLLTDIKGC